MLSKMKGHGGDIKEALKLLDTSITHFQEEVKVCSELRLGRIEDIGLHGHQVMYYMASEIGGMTRGSRTTKNILGVFRKT
jgi:hypothetical protein